MKQAAIIACAGWKGAGRGTEFAHLPAPFLPLRDGMTCASDLSGQFQALGYEVKLVIGPFGYPFKAYQPRHRFWHEGMSSAETAQAIGVDPEDSPWTLELYDYVLSLGLPIAVRDPGWKTKHDSFYEALGELSGRYDRVVLVRGDKLYDPKFLRRLLGTLPWPCQFMLDTFHSIFMLDRDGITAYRAYANAHRDRSTHKSAHNWSLEMARLPDGGEGSGHLALVGGIAHYGWHTPPWDKLDRKGLWHDVDVRYIETRQWCEQGS